MKNINVNRDALRVSLISVAVNLVLTLIKLAAGYCGHSHALIADAVHSASDVVSTLIVIVSLFIAGKNPDADHQYGHQKYENLAVFILGMLLTYVGLKIGVTGVQTIVTKSYTDSDAPSYLTTAAAVLSIIVKEVMYRITIKEAEKEKSETLKADAWHHRSDALSSVGSLAGVLFAQLGLPFMDAAAGIVISIFILRTAVEIMGDAVRVLTDSACGRETDEEIRQTAMNVSGVQGIDLLKTRRFGSGYYVDIEIEVDGNMTTRSAHKIAETVHNKVESDITDVIHCMVHVNPA